MKRRTLLSRFAAIAAAVTVAPAVKAEAAQSLGCQLDSPDADVMLRAAWKSGEMIGWDQGWLVGRDHQRQLSEYDIAEARAEGYERGRAVQASEDDSILSEDYLLPLGDDGYPAHVVGVPMPDGMRLSILREPLHTLQERSNVAAIRTAQMGIDDRKAGIVDDKENPMHMWSREEWGWLYTTWRPCRKEV